MNLVIGSYTEHSHQGSGKGICLADLNPKTGAVTLLSTYSKIPNPSYLALGANGRIYAVSELNPGGQVIALSYTKDQFNELWRRDAGGATCHVAVSPSGHSVAVANYRSGSSKLLSAENGSTLAEWTYQGSGPNKQRQLSSHAHQTIISPNGQWLLVTDLGSDKIWIHAVNGDYPKAPSHSISLPAGAGPRHSVFHTKLNILYTIAELDGYVYWASWDEATGQCQWMGDIRIHSIENSPPPQSSAIKLHPTIPRLYAADRASRQIAVFSINEKGDLNLSGRITVDCEEPRDIELSPDGNWLLITCQMSHEILSIPLDAATGLPNGRVVRSTFGSPACLVFVP